MCGSIRTYFTECSLKGYPRMVNKDQLQTHSFLMMHRKITSIGMGTVIATIIFGSRTMAEGREMKAAMEEASVEGKETTSIVAMEGTEEVSGVVEGAVEVVSKTGMMMEIRISEVEVAEAAVDTIGAREAIALSEEVIGEALEEVIEEALEEGAEITRMMEDSEIVEPAEEQAEEDRSKSQ
jgi:hypothetical protein